MLDHTVVLYVILIFPSFFVVIFIVINRIDYYILCTTVSKATHHTTCIRLYYTVVIYASLHLSKISPASNVRHLFQWAKLGVEILQSANQLSLFAQLMLLYAQSSVELLYQKLHVVQPLRFLMCQQL